MSSRFLIPLLWIVGQCLLGQNQLKQFDFQVLVPQGGTQEVKVQKMQGTERRNNSQNRLSIISESQYEYPVPESGCGPIALLNTLVWYEKYGLIQPLFRESDPLDYKRNLFAAIDARLMRSSGLARKERKGARTIDIALVLDAIVREQSAGELRVHYDYVPSPVGLDELLRTMPNFRTGILLGYPKDPATGELMPVLHAVLLIRADRAGYLTVATWGEKYRGLLRMRAGEQWFVPQAPHSVEIKIKGMMRFIPFEPTEQLNMERRINR